MAKVFLGIPQHGGQMSAQTFQSALTAASLQDHDMEYQVLGLSLLARNFTQLWINAWRNGFDVFILHHSDLGVYPLEAMGIGSWIDVIVDRLFRTKAAAISVASPIKSHLGHTSFGMQLERGDNPWKLRRATIKQLNQMPKTINREDVCKVLGLDPATAGAMLVNTGCLAMNLRDFKWNEARWPGFQIADKLGWNADCSECESFTEPEDWRLSRWLFDKGWPYYCIRDLGIDHVGGHIFKNHGDWGVEQDDAPLSVGLHEFEKS